MTPTTFPQQNTVIGKPEDLDESQCADIPGYIFTIEGGNLDGTKAITVAWKPNKDEMVEIVTEGIIYVTFLNAIVGHTVQTSFKEATAFQ